MATKKKSSKKKASKKKAGTKAGKKNARWCFAWMPKVKGRTRAAALTAMRWLPGSVITIGFMDGDAAVKKRVKDAANAWVAPGLAGLTFKWKNNADAMIRISFAFSGSWSTIGTGCLTVPADEPTMNFGWLDASSTDEEVREVVLHEFGHALGLIHEHQHPKNGIQWNKPVIYAELGGPPNNWDKATIDFNMFQAFSKTETNFTRFDKKSIMMYPFPAHWTLNGFSTGNNTKLSKNDKQLIRRLYP